MGTTFCQVDRYTAEKGTMSEERHPSEMNLLQRYGDTVRTAKTTSRMKNQAWYQDALDLELQVHCYLQHEGDLECFVYIKSRDEFQKLRG